MAAQQKSLCVNCGPSQLGRIRLSLSGFSFRVAVQSKILGKDKDMDKCEDKNAVCADKDAEQAGAKLREELPPPGLQPRVVQQQQNTEGRSALPPYMLEELAKRTHDKIYQETLDTNKDLEQQGKFQPRVTSGANGAREVYDAKGKETHPGDRARFEGEAATGNTNVDNVYDYTGIVRQFYKEVHGKDSIDGNGMKMISTVNYGDNYQNAFWNGKQMTYGQPAEKSPFKTFVLLDVTGHEITHGVTQKTGGVFYWGQAGALNEHISDVFGELIQQKHRGQSADQADWIIGDGIWKDGVKGTGIRNMLNPGTAYDDPKIGKDPQPAHMKDYVSTWKDAGGVHYNSGIPNRAFALFAKSVGGNAWETPGKIWYEATQHVGMFPSFASFAALTIDAAKKMGTAQDVAKLEQAWADVGVKPKHGVLDILTPGRPTGKDGKIQTDDDDEEHRNGPLAPPINDLVPSR